MNRIRSRVPCRVALDRATARAPPERSNAYTVAPGRSQAIATAMQPDPVPTSAIIGSSHSATARSASSTRSSVSGLGISTSGVTAMSRPRNSCVPRMYWSGSRAARRLRRDQACSACSTETGRSPSRISACDGTPRADARSQSVSLATLTISASLRRSHACRRRSPMVTVSAAAPALISPPPPQPGPRRSAPR